MLHFEFSSHLKRYMWGFQVPTTIITDRKQSHAKDAAIKSRNRLEEIAGSLWQILVKILLDRGVYLAYSRKYHDYVNFENTALVSQTSTMLLSHCFKFAKLAARITTRPSGLKKQTENQTRLDQTRPDRHKKSNLSKNTNIWSGFETRLKPDRKPDQTRLDQTEQKYRNCDPCWPHLSLKKKVR